MDNTLAMVGKTLGRYQIVEMLGAVEPFEAIADLLPHAVELIRGGAVRHD